jgi:ribulose 1,5-bisphosphate synthetase/thiazole synthase
LTPPCSQFKVLPSKKKFFSKECCSKINEPQRKISVLDEADVVVAGGRPSDIGGALSAARTGAQTILIEKFLYPKKT